MSEIFQSDYFLEFYFMYQEESFFNLRTINVSVKLKRILSQFKRKLIEKKKKKPNAFKNNRV